VPFVRLFHIIKIMTICYLTHANCSVTSIQSLMIYVLKCIVINFLCVEAYVLSCRKELDLSNWDLSLIVLRFASNSSRMDR
jgi:hypothetical protein